MNRRVFVQQGLCLAAGAAMLGRLPGLAGSEVPGKTGGGAIRMDTYEPWEIAVDVWQRAGINVVIRDVMNWRDAPPLELKVGQAPGKVSDLPPPGLNVWDNARSEREMVQLLMQGIVEQLLFIERNRDRVALALTTDDVDKIVRGGRIAMILMLKSPWIDHDLAVLRTCYRLGVRVTSLVHAAASDWADSAVELNAKPGLADFGREFVREAQRLGMIVDLSHASDPTAWDVLAATGRPLIATHAQCRAVFNSTRSTSDEMLRAIAKNGGLVGVLLPSKTQDFDLEELDHAVNVAGVDHVAVCSHSTSVEKWSGLVEALRARGLSASAVDQVLGGNFFRIFGPVMGRPAV